MINLYKIVEECVANVVKLTEEKNSFAEICSKTMNVVHNLGVEVLQYVCQNIDDDFAEKHKKEVLVRHRQKTRHILTEMGEFVLKRRLYQYKSSGKYFFAVDKLLQMEKYAHIESGFKGKILEQAVTSSYGKASHYAAHGNISRQTVFNIVKGIKNIPSIVDDEKKQKQVSELFIEADEDHIHLNDGKSCEVKMVYVHEGVNCQNNRKSLINPHYFTYVNSNVDDFWSDIYGYVENNYSAEKLHFASDGGNWIKNGLTVFPKAIRHMDKFHIFKAVKILAGGDIELQRDILESINEKSMEKLNILFKQKLQTITKTAERKLFFVYMTYILNNLSDIDLYGVPCSAEGHISHILSARMSSRPMGWSKDGADRIAKLRAYMYNGGDFQKLVMINMQNNCTIK